MLNPIRIITEGHLQEVVSDAFSRVVGLHKPHSVSEIAAATGRCDSYWGGVRSRTRVPSLNAFLNASAAMDPEHGAAFLNEVLALAGFTGVRPVEAKKTCPLEVIKHGTDTLRLCAEVLEDGVVTKEEALQVAARLREYAAMADGVSETPKLRSV